MHVPEMLVLPNFAGFCRPKLVINIQYICNEYHLVVARWGMATTITRESPWVSPRDFPPLYACMGPSAGENPDAKVTVQLSHYYTCDYFLFSG